MTDPLVYDAGDPAVMANPFPVYDRLRSGNILDRPPSGILFDDRFRHRSDRFASDPVQAAQEVHEVVFLGPKGGRC